MVKDKMQTKIIKVDQINPDPDALKPAADILKKGGLVAFPTETVYGLGAVYNNDDALKGIFKVKGRPGDNPLIVHIWKIEQLDQLVETIHPEYQCLINAFWPGPLTLIFPKKAEVSSLVTAGLNTVAVRMPSHPVSRVLFQLTDLPVAAPSANLSGSPSPTLGTHVKHDFDGKIPIIIDSGSCDAGIESTVFAFSGNQPYILRPGSITREMLEKVLGKPVISVSPGEVERPQAPGMKYRHYAPEAPVIMVEGNNELVVEKINQLIQEKIQEKSLNFQVVILSTTENLNQYPRGRVLDMGSKNNLDEAAKRIYQLLRQCDKLKADLVIIEGMGEEGIGFAIQNRLHKAAGGNIIHVS